ncbi:hypothetical protein FRC16_005402 [Serendipita sp. 398]|nr:hypothetical protein FRC16_005402 [Serendipita sp. 398]
MSTEGAQAVSTSRGRSVSAAPMSIGGKPYSQRAIMSLVKRPVGTVRNHWTSSTLPSDVCASARGERRSAFSPSRIIPRTIREHAIPCTTRMQLEMMSVYSSAE